MSKATITGIVLVMFGVFVIGITLGGAAGESRQKKKTDTKIIKLQTKLDMAKLEIEILDAKLYARDSQLRDLRQPGYVPAEQAEIVPATPEVER